MTQARDNFVRLAENRTRQAMKALRLIGNLSNKSNYSYSEQDVSKIFRVLEAELKYARRRFNENRNSTKVVEFELE
jgi:hypothetical protein